MQVIVVVLGVLAGGMTDGMFGAIAGGLLAWLLWRSRTQQQQIQRLQQALLQLPPLQPLQPLLQPTTTVAAEPAGASPVDAPVETAVEGPVAPPVVTSLAEAAPAPPGAIHSPPPPEAAAAAPADPGEPGWIDRARAWLLGGNAIAKAGVGILFVGLAFLAKYANDQALLPVELRLAGIAGVALALLVLGWRWRGTRPAYAQALQGGAVAVLYLTLFVAFRFYGVLAAGPVFALMVLVAGLAAALAVLQDARGLALIGALGGFATPLLVSSGEGNAAALFSYYLVLDLGIAAVAWFRHWRLLNSLGFAFTFGVATTWGVLRYDPAQYALAQGFLVAYFLLFNAVLLLPARRLAAGPSRSDAWVNGSLLFGLPTVGFALQHGLVRHSAYGTALSALVLAAFYLALAMRLRRVPALAVLLDGALAIATVFTSLVIPFALDARSTGGAWALEGAGLLWLGFRQQRRVPRLFGFALLLLASAVLLWSHGQDAAPTTVFNAWFLSALLLSLSLLAGAWFVHRGTTAGQGMPGEALAEPVLIGGGLLWALGAAARQIAAFASTEQVIASWLLAWALIAAACAALVVRLRWRNLGLPLMGLAPLLLLAALAGVPLLDHPAQHGGGLAWPLALAVQLLLLRQLAPQWPATARPTVHALGPVVLAVLGAHLGCDITGAWGDAATAWPWLGALALPALLLWLLPRPATAGRWPVSAEAGAYQVGASAVLAIGLLLWTLLANAMSTGAAQPLPHLPLFNPLDLGTAGALLAVLMWLRQPAMQQHSPAIGRLSVAGLSGVGFFWLNAMLLRAFHHWAGVPYRMDSWLDSLPVQTGVALLWSATALVLMWGSARQARRGPWMLGAVLLAAVVAKLLLLDLAGSGTLTRIVSFIGVGLLMLVIGYVAPLPSNRSRHETA